ncbi:hypothetical protein [Spirosoma sp.]|uniref:hypothetical protein n=1 Tax=Spirosoma sp. TaxID=1899569 RepID=UPI002611A218|nr:hypothetical protein [Spirosoma sp.]MCX6214204.1 hypothetical protein [Spirosoma sp.]
MIVEHALNDFYHQHGYGEEGGINKKWDMIKFGSIALPLPNLESRRKNIYLHDISHLVTGYDVSWLGESSVSSWEIATGGWGRLYFPWLLTLWAMAVGVMLYPGQSYRAFQAGLRMKNALISDLTKQEMYQLSLAELRVRLQRTESEFVNRSYYLWASLSLLVWWSPFLIGCMLYSVW